MKADHEAPLTPRDGRMAEHLRALADALDAGRATAGLVQLAEGGHWTTVEVVATGDEPLPVWHGEQQEGVA